MKNSAIKSKKGQVTSIIAGVGGLIIIAIITLILVSTVLNADLFTNSRYVVTETVVNETGGFVNETGYTLAQFTTSNWTNFQVLAVYNVTQDNDELINAANYTFTSATGIIVNATDDDPFFNWANVNITYTYDYTAYTGEDQSAVDLGGNLSEGIHNVSAKIPTILLLAAVLLLFGVLAFLIAKSNMLGIGGSQGSL